MSPVHKPKLLVTKKTKLPIYVTRVPVAGYTPACCHCEHNGDFEGIGPFGEFDCPLHGRSWVFGICLEFEPEDGTEMLLWNAEKKIAEEYTHKAEE